MINLITFGFCIGSAIAIFETLSQVQKQIVSIAKADRKSSELADRISEKYFELFETNQKLENISNQCPQAMKYPPGILIGLQNQSSYLKNLLEFKTNEINSLVQDSFHILEFIDQGLPSFLDVCGFWSPKQWVVGCDLLKMKQTLKPHSGGFLIQKSPCVSFTPRNLVWKFSSSQVLPL